MHSPLFEFPSYRYEVDDWEFKKKALLNRINDRDFVRTEHQCFESDRGSNGKTYVRYLENYLKPILNQFCQEAQVTCCMTDAWCVRYQKGDYQTVHNHRGWGFSGVLYLEFDPKIHTSTTFVAPWQNPTNDTTNLVSLKNMKEGIVFIFPSFVHHYVTPNQVRKQRSIISFDLLPQLPEHQSLNKNV